MTKRFLQIAAALALLSACAPKEQLPPFVMPQAEEAFARFETWKGQDETIVFPILTDVHAQERETYKHVGYIAATDAVFHYDFMLSLGDIGLNLGISGKSKAHSDTIKMFTRAEMDKFDGVFLYGAGNHDWDAGEGEFHTSQYLSDLFQKPALERAGGNLHLVPGKVYCWYDIPEKNFRIIVLNSEGTETQGGTYYIYDQEQFRWLRNLLEATPSDMNVLVASHYMPHPNGRWHNTPEPYTFESNCKMMDLLAEYKATRNIIGLFAGDSHFNMHEVDRGVNYYVTQSYGICSDEQLMPGTRHAIYDYNETLCCDIIAVKPSARQVHTFRMGAGGEEFDYEFGY